MNILNHGKKCKVTMPTLDEIFKILNESMPNQQLVIPRSDTADSPDLNEIALESFTWYDVGEIICMLQKLENDPESPVLGKLCSSLCHITPHILHLYKKHMIIYPLICSIFSFDRTCC